MMETLNLLRTWLLVDTTWIAKAMSIVNVNIEQNINYWYILSTCVLHTM